MTEIALRSGEKVKHGRRSRMQLSSVVTADAGANDQVDEVGYEGTKIGTSKSGLRK